MELKLNLDIISSYGLSPNEYIVLYLIHNNQLNTVGFKVDKVIEKLKSKGIIDNQKRIITDLPNDLFGDNKPQETEVYWLEFQSLYPKKDGVRRLHDSPSKCKEKYHRLLRRDIEVHTKVLKGLKNEKSLREKAELRGEFFQAPKLMSTYINQKAWEGYQDDIESETSNGRDII